MNDGVPFQAADGDIHEPKTYYPLPVPVRGELVAWAVVAVLLALCGVLIWRTGTLSLWVLIFTLLMILLAIAIRFGRWMEANTRIELDPQGIRHASPLRTRDLRWDEIDRLAAGQAGDGWWIFVVGESGGFRFQTITTLRGAGGQEIHTGYPRGAEIIGQILREASFREPQFEEPNWVWRAE